MKLTGKTKDAFEKWLKNRFMDSGLIQVSPVHPHILFDVSSEFYLLPYSMKFGVYQDFFDSVGIYINIDYNEMGKYFQYYMVLSAVINNVLNSEFNTRQEARTEAIEKADEIYNELSQ